MLVTRAHDADSLSSRNGRHPLSRRNTAASDSRWLISRNNLLSFSPDDEEEPISSKIRVRINVSGAMFETFNKTLQRFPSTLLGSSEHRLKYYRRENDEYFFNRNRESFESILYFYQSSGKLIKPVNVGVKVFIEELKFFEMGDSIINCFIERVHFSEENNLEDTTRKNLCSKIWNFLEHPQSSLALAVAFISMIIILISVVLFCMETIHPFTTNPEKRILQQIEMFCVTWFSAELVMRSITSPAKWIFIKSFLNIIDLLAILPFYITLVSLLFLRDKHATPLAFLRVIRLVRVLRIFKLSRHMRILKILGMTFKSSVNELFLLLLFIIIAVVIFSSLVFYADSHFDSIPDAFWWAIITLTNVGYGDAVPETWLGKIIGSLCAVCGIIVLALPIPVIVSSFMYFYSMEKENQKLEKIETNGKNISLQTQTSSKKLIGNSRVSPVNDLVQDKTVTS